MNYLTSLLPICRCEPCIESCYTSVEKANKEIYRCVYWSLFCTGTAALGIAAFGFATLAGRVSAESALLGLGGSLLCVVTCCGWYCLFIHESSRVERETNRTINRAVNGVAANAEQVKKVEVELHEVNEKMTELSSTMQKRTQAVEGLQSQTEKTTETLIQIAEDQKLRIGETKEVTEKIAEQNQNLKQNISNAERLLTQLPIPSERSEGLRTALTELDELESRFKLENKNERK